MLIHICEGDLLEQEVVVIVNPWNRNLIPWWLLLPQGVSGAIKRRGGNEPFRELARKGMIPLGGAVITSAGQLPFQALIHVAGINLLWRSSEKAIRNSVRNALRIAQDRNYASIGFPLIGTGSGGFPAERALEIMQDEAAKSKFKGEIRFVRYRAPQKK